MDSFDVKLEKANAVSRYRRLQKLTLVFRLVEFFVFLFMISKISSQIMMPFAFKFSAEYFQGVYNAVFSTCFVFLLGNAIIVALFIKSGQLSSAGTRDNSSNCKLDFYDEYVKSCTQRSETVINKDHEEIRKVMCRSRSENLIVQENHEEIRLTHRKLRSLTSEISSCRKIEEEEEEEEEKKSCYAAAAEDELSGEEFRRTVEAFIARQQKSLRDEEFAPIVYIGPSLI